MNWTGKTAQEETPVNFSISPTWLLLVSDISLPGRTANCSDTPAGLPLKS